MINSVEPQDAALDILLEKVYRDSRYDFRDYRLGTLTRRLERRMLADFLRKDRAQYDITVIFYRTGIAIG